MKSLAAIAVCLTLRAEIIDRVAITVANQVVTQSELNRQARIAAFPKALPARIPADVVRETAERLIEQSLIQREMEISRYPAPQAVEADAELEKLKARLFKSDEQYRAELKRAGITEEELKRHLLRQLMIMRFIDLRFRPGIQVSNADIEEYHKRHFAGKGLPLDEVRSKIEQILTDERVNEALDRWLEETRARTYITYNPEVLR